MALGLCALLGCASGVEYQPPTPEVREYKVDVDRPRKDIWASLTDYVKDLDFLVEMNEPAIGLFKGSFTARNIAELVDCGHTKWETSDVSFDGPAAQYIQEHANGALRVVLEVRGKDVQDGRTQITVKAGYALEATASGGPLKPGVYSLSFGTEDSDTLRVNDVSRTCRPTYSLERRVLEIASGQAQR